MSRRTRSGAGGDIRKSENVGPNYEEDLHRRPWADRENPESFYDGGNKAIQSENCNQFDHPGMPINEGNYDRLFEGGGGKKGRKK